MRQLAIRLLQLLALYAPGAASVRVLLHRLRGVRIGRGAFISTDVIIETAHPELVRLGDNVCLGIRTTVIAHFRDVRPGAVQAGGFSVEIEDDAWIGPGSIVLPGVRIGRGAVVAAGSVVSGNVPAMTMVQGNPARPVAACGIPLGANGSAEEFYRRLRPLGRARA